MVRETLGENFVFYASGIQNGTVKVQIENFNKEILDFGGKNLIPAGNWNEAFNNLNLLIEGTNSQDKKVIFLDEVP